MDWIILTGITLGAALTVALVARAVARRISAAEGEVGFWPILISIVLSAVVLLGAAKLAVLVGEIYARAGIDPATAMAGKLPTVLFAASFVPIAAYVLTFLFTFKMAKGAK